MLTPAREHAGGTTQPLLERLGRLLPASAIDTDPAARAARARDRWPAAAKWDDDQLAARLPAAVLRPETTEQVSEILAAANELGTAVIPFGAGSGVVGGVVGDGGHVVIDLGAMSDVLDFADANGEVTVQAGLLGVDLDTALRERGRRVPHYPQSLALATVGGLVATRSSGTFSSKYGNIEDLLVALTVVLADGRIIRTRAVPRASTGPSISQLFIGSEGTLGVITEVTLRTIPLARSTQFRGVAFDRLGDGIAAVRALLDDGLTPAVIRLYDAGEAVHLFERSGIDPNGRTLLILAFDGNDDVVQAEESAALRIAAEHGGDDLGPEPGETWERTRFDASWLDRGNAGEFAFADAIEVSASWPVLESLHDEVLERLRPHVSVAYSHFSHFYPNGAALYIIVFVEGDDRESALASYRAAWQETTRAALAAGGSMGHHHGVGEARREWMTDEHGAALHVLGAIKAALDPNGILAPGKLGIEEVSA